MNSEEFQRFVTAKGIDTKCNSCGEDRWYLFEDPLHLSGKQGVLVTRVITAYLLTCLNCGNARTYVKSVVDEWLKENGKTPI